MSNKKLISRDKTSGFWNPTDVPVGEYGATELSNRLASQQEQINEAITADWKKGYDAAGNPCLGDALAREPKPSDYLNRNDRAGAVNRDRYAVE